MMDNSIELNNPSTNFFDKYQKNACKIISLSPEHPDRLYIFNLVCEPNDSPDQLRALLLCRKALEVDQISVGGLSNEQHSFLTNIWNKLTRRLNKNDPALSNVLSICFLLDRLLLSEEISEHLKSDSSITNFFQTILLGEENDLRRKYVYTILRNIRDPEQSLPWQTFFVIYDTLAEKQSHLILPVLDLLDKTKELPFGWHTTLVAHALNCNNSLITRRLVEIILVSSPAIYETTTTSTLILQERFFKALNTTSFYDSLENNQSSIRVETLQTYFEHPDHDVCTLLDNICHISWRSVPFFNIITALSKVLHLSKWAVEYLPKFVEQAHALPNEQIRHAALVRLEDADNSIDREDERIPISEKTYIIQRRQMLLLLDFSQCGSTEYQTEKNKNLDLWIIDEVKNRVNEIIEKCLAELKPISSEHLQTETERCVNFLVNYKSKNWASNIVDEDRLKRIKLLGFNRNKYFSMDLRCLTAAVLTKLLLCVDDNLLECNRLIGILIDYDLQLALQVLLLNVKLVSDDLFERIFYEIQSGRETHLIGNFLNVLEFLDQYDSDKCERYKHIYYKLSTELASSIPKWMTIVSCHRDIWRYIYLNSDFMFNALIYGQHSKGDQLIEKKYEIQIDKESEITVRCHALKLLYDIDANNCISEFNALRQRIFDHLGVLRKKTRYYANSETHRIKLRLVQALAVMSHKHSQWHDDLGVMLLEENNQLNVTYIVERIVGEIATPEQLLELLKKAVTPNARRSIFMCIFYSSQSKKYSNDVQVIESYIRAMSVWTMGKDYNTRLFAQTTIKKILESQTNCVFEFLLETIRNSLELDEHPDIVLRVSDDFRFGSQFCQYWKPMDYLHSIPRITGMCPLDIFPIWCVNRIDFDKGALFEVPYMQQLSKQSKQVHTELIELNIGNVQKKIVPLKELFPDALDEATTSGCNKEKKSGLVVVASLISRSANLGGLSRTCEIFGAEKLVLDSLRHIENSDFQALSMTSEKWLRIAEVKPFHLVDYLVEMKHQGYAIIGAEQTANGITINELKFPQKTVLLLGHEKEGIPANLLSLLDHAVEIPQFGVVRSLNVHVTGALFIWEYAKQHNAFV